MSIHLHTIQKAVLVPASVLALSLTLPAAPALAQPAATVFASDPVDCSTFALGIPALVGGAAGAFGGPVTAGLGAAIGGEIGCGTDIALKLSKKNSTPAAPPSAPNTPAAPNK